MPPARHSRPPSAVSSTCHSAEQALASTRRSVPSRKAWSPVFGGRAERIMPRLEWSEREPRAHSDTPVRRWRRSRCLGSRGWSRLWPRRMRSDSSSSSSRARNGVSKPGPLRRNGALPVTADTPGCAVRRAVRACPRARCPEGTRSLAIANAEAVLPRRQPLDGTNVTSGHRCPARRGHRRPHGRRPRGRRPSHPGPALAGGGGRRLSCDSSARWGWPSGRDRDGAPLHRPAQG